jgi:hypothetical protein
LGAESRIAQARAAVFTRLTVAKAITTAVTKTTGTWTPVATGARPALARTAITAAIAPGWCFGTLLARPIVTAHRHHRFGGLGCNHKRRRLFWEHAVRSGSGLRRFGSCRVAGLFVCWNLCGCVCSG